GVLLRRRGSNPLRGGAPPPGRTSPVDGRHGLRARGAAVP
ncbi:hypothetical protein EE612_012197, partial [Oryza sativa]